jgi:hypothetical protein
MRSRVSLRRWIQQLLPQATPCTQAAAAQLLRALLVGFTTNLAQLARQLDRPGTAKGARQWLARVLDRPHFAPDTLYADLLHVLPDAILHARSGPVPLLVDLTFFAQQWVVLQVSLPWERRALPLLRVVQPYQGEERSQAQAVAQALAWLQQHLPGGYQRYLLVMDRGFPGHAFLNQLRATGWRFLIRIEGRWRVEHRDYVGSLLDLGTALPVGSVPGLLRDAHLGERGRGLQRSSQAHVVYFRGEGHQAPWYLVTSETDPALAIALYRQRMQIEQEFRDLKGYWGLDHLAAWLDQEQVARFLAWLAVYEWRLAYLWQTYRLQQFQAELRVGGQLSWIRTVREWLARQLRLLKPIPDLRL